VRPKNTNRAEARRRHRDETRETEVEPIEFEEADDAAQTAQTAKTAKRPGFAMPNVLDDLKALPQVFRKPLVWLPFGLLALTFILAVALINDAFVEAPDPVQQGVSLYVSLTLHPTTLFIFFIGGFLAPRASYLVGGMLGLLSGIIFVVVMSLLTEATAVANVDALVTSADGTLPSITAEYAMQNIGLGVLIGVAAGGFASWYRRFLRSSQERAKLNRMAKEQEKAKEAKEQARADKQAARDARRNV